MWSGSDYCIVVVIEQFMNVVGEDMGLWPSGTLSQTYPNSNSILQGEPGRVTEVTFY